MSKNRDDFDNKTKEQLAKRAAFICSNPDCKNLTIAPADIDDSKFVYIGKAAHITAASKGGARYDDTITSQERKSINNGIFLCSNCADMIDKNKGLDYSVDLLKQWKSEHEKWIRENLNKNLKENNLQTSFQVTSFGQSGGITAGIVNIQASSAYKPISRNLQDTINSNLSKLVEKYNSNYPAIIIEVESGNSLRHKVALDLENLITPIGLGSYRKGNTFMGRFPEHPITVLGNESNIDFFKDFEASIRPYLQSSWFYQLTPDLPDNVLKVYINGTPSFRSEGQVEID